MKKLRVEGVFKAHEASIFSEIRAVIFIFSGTSSLKAKFRVPIFNIENFT